MNITVTHTIHPEVMSMLASVFSGSSLVPKTENKVNGKASIAAPSSEETVVNDSTDTITVEAVRAAVQAKPKEKRKDVKALLSEFGTDSVTNLTKESYADFMVKLNKI